MHREMWKYLKDVSLLLKGVTETLEELNNLLPNQVVEAKQLLTCQSLELKYGYTVKAITTTHYIQYVTNEEREILPGILLYVTEGVLPMLKVKI